MKSIRRLYFYLVAFISIEIVLWGLVGLLRSIVNETVSGGADALAQALALILVGVPIFLIHWLWAQRASARDDEEKIASLRAVFLYAILLATLIPVVQNLLSFLDRSFVQIAGLGVDRAFRAFSEQTLADNLIAIAMNSIVAAYFWNILRNEWATLPNKENFADVRRLYRYIWMLYGLLMTVFGAQQILRFSGTTGTFMGVFNSGGPPLDSAFAGLVFGPDGHLYASRYHADLIERYNGTTGAFIDTFVSAGSGGLNTPDYLTFGPDGNLYVASLSTGNILRYDGTTGAFIDVFTSGGGVLFPKGLVFFTLAPAPVGGAVSGISPEQGTVVCRNLTTHEAVHIPLDAATSWNCEDTGLVVSPGDQIKIQLQIKGTAQ